MQSLQGPLQGRLKGPLQDCFFPDLYPRVAGQPWAVMYNTFGVKSCKSEVYREAV